LNFIERFSKSIQILNFVRIRLVGAELFQVDRSTDWWTGRTREGQAWRS